MALKLIEPLKVGGAVSKEKPTVINLTDYRIRHTDPIPPNVYVAKINGRNKFSRKNISAWIGKAKSKKTFAMTMLGTAMSAGIDLYETFYSYNPNKVLWIDTEQSPVDAQKIVFRLQKLNGNIDNFFLYGLRPLSPKERIEMIQDALKLHKPDVLVIDGIRDLVWNINDPVESTTIVTMVMKWSFDFDMHIAVVIHQTNDGKARGHIGTEIENKAETVIKIERNEHNQEISNIQENFGRGKGFTDFDFYIDEKGLPVVANVEFKQITADEDDIPF